MTIRQIMKMTPPSRRDSSQYVKVTAVKVKRSKDGFPLVLAQTIATKTNLGEKKSPTPTHKYITTIEVRNKNSVIVSCSCEDFTFTWETALAKKGAAVIEYSNGQKPVDRNPKQIPGCCKHIYKLAENLISDGRL